MIPSKTESNPVCCTSQCITLSLVDGTDVNISIFCSLILPRFKLRPFLDSSLILSNELRQGLNSLVSNLFREFLDPQCSIFRIVVSNASSRYIFRYWHFFSYSHIPPHPCLVDLFSLPTFLFYLWFSVWGRFPRFPRNGGS